MEEKEITTEMYFYYHEESRHKTAIWGNPTEIDDKNTKELSNALSKPINAIKLLNVLAKQINNKNKYKPTPTNPRV